MLHGATVDELVVVARGEGGLGAFVVPRAEVRVEARNVIDPTMPIADIVLDGVTVPADRVLAAPGSGCEEALRRAVDEATVAMAVATVGTCRRIFEMTVEYAKERVQYDRPIGSFQALKHRLADVYVAVERAASLGWYAALTIAEDDPRRREAASLAKAAAADCQELVVGEGLQMHGGIGMTWEHDLHFFLKRAKAGEVLLGGGAHHRAVVGTLLGDHRRSDGGGLVKLSFDPAVEAFRQEFLDWLAANRPARRRDGRRPGGVVAPTCRRGPGSSSGACSTTGGSSRGGRRSGAAATPDRSRRSSTSRSSPRPTSRGPPTPRASASSPRRSSTTAPPSRSRSTPCRCCRASGPPASA